MGLTITQKVAEQSEAVQSAVATNEVTTKVDQYAGAAKELTEKLKALEPLTTLVAALKSDLQEYANEVYLADEKVTLEGLNHTMLLGQRAKKVTDIDTGKLFTALGSDTYIEIAKVGVGDIRKYCTPPQLEDILTEEQSGARSVKIKDK